MDDALAVRGRKATADLASEPQRLLKGQRPLREPLRERLSLEVLHDQEIDVASLDDIVKHADIRMLKAGDRHRFPSEARA